MKNKILHIINAGIRRKSYWYNNVLFADCPKFWKHRTFNLDIVNLGSSSGKYAFDYSGLELKGANWAMAPQSLVADMAILKTYSSFLKSQGGIVLIPLCPFSCLGGSSLYLPDKYYSILRMPSIPSCSYKKQQEVFDKRNNPLRYYPAIEMIRDIWRLFRSPANSIPEKKFSQNAEHFINGWMHEFSILDFKNPLILKNQDAYKDGVRILNEMIQFCLERNFRPVIVIPPVTKQLLSCFTADMRERFIYSFIEQGNKQGVEFLDYFEDADFSDNPKLFRNSFFLNNAGAKHFTRRVLKDLEIQREGGLEE